MILYVYMGVDVKPSAWSFNHYVNDPKRNSLASVTLVAKSELEIYKE